MTCTVWHCMWLCGTTGIKARRNWRCDFRSWVCSIVAWGKWHHSNDIILFFGFSLSQVNRLEETLGQFWGFVDVSDKMRWWNLLKSGEKIRN